MDIQLDISTEITEEKFRAIVKSYYLKKSWDKLIALLSVIAVAWAASMTMPGYYRSHVWLYYSYFNALFMLLMFFFFAIPYLVLYSEMRRVLKKENFTTGMYNYHIAENGIRVVTNDVDKSYAWSMITKVCTAPGIVIMKVNYAELLIIVFAESDGNSNQSFLQLAKANTPNAKWKILKD